MDVSINGKALRNTFGVTFAEDVNTFLKANSDGHLLWNNAVVHTGAATSGVENPMQVNLDANGHRISNLSAINCQASESSDGGFESGTIKSDLISSQNWLYVDSQNVMLRSGIDNTTNMALRLSATGAVLSQPTTQQASQGALAIESRDSSDLGYLDVGGANSDLDLLFNGVKLTSSNSSGSHSMANVKDVTFDSDTVLTTTTKSQAGSETVELSYEGDILATYDVPGANVQALSRIIYNNYQTGIKPISNLLSQNDTDLKPCSAVMTYAPPDGNLNYLTKLEVTTVTKQLTEWVFDLWACSNAVVTTGVNESSPVYPTIASGSYKVCSIDSSGLEFKESTDFLTRTYSFTVTNGADSSVDGVTNYGLNKTALDGKTHFYWVAKAQYLDPNNGDAITPYTITGLTGYMSRVFGSSAVAIGDAVLHTDSSDLFLGNELVSTSTVHSLQTTDDSAHVIGTKQIPLNTGGVIRGFCFSDSSCWQFTAFASRGAEGDCSLAGVLVEELTPSTDHTFALSVNGGSVEATVEGSTDSTHNWKINWTFDSVAKYVAPLPVDRLLFHALFENNLDVEGGLDTISGSPSGFSYVNDRDGNANSAIFFPSGNPGLEYTNNYTWNQESSKFTVTGYMKVDASNNGNVLLFSLFNEQFGFAVRTNWRYYQFNLFAENRCTYYANWGTLSSITVGSWHYFSASYDGSKSLSERLRMSIDNVFQNQTVWPTGEPLPESYSDVTDCTARVGYMRSVAGQNSTTSGSVDDVRYFNYVLSDDEIEAIRTT